METPGLFDEVYEDYLHAQSDREAMFQLFRGVVRIAQRARNSRTEAALNLATAAATWLMLLTFLTFVWPTLHTYQIDAGHNVVIHTNRLTGHVDVTPIN